MRKKYILLFIFVSLMFYSKVEAFEQYLEGEKVNYKGEDYYVISYSDENTKYVTLLKDKSLTVDEIYKYGSDESGKLFVNKDVINTSDPEKVVYEFNNNIGGIAFYSSDDCSSKYYWDGSIINILESVENGCINDYNYSYIKKVVDNWSNDKINDLVEVNGYKSRILSIDELISNFQYYFRYNASNYMESDNVPNWLKTLYSDNEFWLMRRDTNIIDNSIKMGVFRINNVYFNNVYNVGAVKPIINLNKCALGDSDNFCKTQNSNEKVCTKKITKYREYKVCSQVEYKGDKYYVIEKNNSNQNYITLLKIESLSPTNIVNNSDAIIGKSFYATNLKFIGSDNSYKTSLSSSYKFSYVKKILDNWEKNELDENDLIEVDGYKVRLLLDDEMYSTGNSSIFMYDEQYWKMEKNYSDSLESYISKIYLERAIKPVINLKKDKIDNIDNYQVGDIVSYKDNDYYIIKISDENYITLFKKDALTQNQINKYGERILTSYDNALNLTNIWAEKFKEDLVNVDGRTSGLLTVADLFEKFGYDYCLVNSDSRICKTDITPSCLESDYWYWIIDDGKYEVYDDGKKLSAGPYIIAWDEGNNLAVRPMINVKKCAIDGACYEEDEEVPCEETSEIIIEPEKEPEKEKTIIEAENTFKTISYMLIIIGSLLIIGGYILYKRIKKEVK